jgi:hypothetical protein
MAILAVVIWKVDARGLNEFLAVTGAGRAIHFVTRYVDRRRLDKLTRLFDNGVAETQSAMSRANASVFGKFHERQTEISVGRLGFPNIRISLAGDFGVQFQVRSKLFNKTRALRGVYWLVLLGLVLYASVRWENKLPSIMGTLAGTIAGIYLAQFLPLHWGRFGTTSFYKYQKVLASFPGSESLEFSAGSPGTFGALIERREIQYAVSRLILSCQIDLLCVVYRSRRETKGYTLEANYRYRKQWLEPSMRKRCCSISSSSVRALRPYDERFSSVMAAGPAP